MDMLARVSTGYRSDILKGVDYDALVDEISRSSSLQDLTRCRDTIDTIITRALRKFVPEQTLCEHCLDSFIGGRRLKPLLVLLGVSIQDQTVNDKALISATALECFTSATVVIDDIIDGDEIRGHRGTPTIHAKYGVGEASLIGAIMSKVSVTILSRYFPDAVEYYMKLFGTIASAEYSRSFDFVGDKLPSEAQYLDMITGVNALAYRACFQLAAQSTGRSEAFQRQFANIALPIGVAEQLGDDFHDLREDFAVGTRTLPAILIARRFPERTLDMELIEEVLADRDCYNELASAVNVHIQDSIETARRRLEALYPDDGDLTVLQRRSKDRLLEVIEHMKRKWEGHRMMRHGKIERETDRVNDQPE